MELIHKITELRSLLASVDRKIALIPTMGALHQGHLSLVRAAQQDGYFTIVSVFVNPKQFGDATDFDSYPRTLGVDARLLTDADVDALFAPSVQEIYPPGVTLVQPSAGELGKQFEGEFRPGHFDGMLLVVNRLFDLVQPNAAYFGEKDFQQLALIRQMVSQQVIAGQREPIKIVGCPTVRDQDGLALSSRNIRILPEHLAAAKSLSKALRAGAEVSGSREQVLTAAKAELDPVTRLEYLELVDSESFKVLERVQPGARLIIAAWVGSVRLIDNLLIGEK